MNVADLVAIDMHTHAEVSCCQPPDLFVKEFDEASDKYFGAVIKAASGRRPTMPETIDYYRERKSEEDKHGRIAGKEEIGRTDRLHVANLFIIEHDLRPVAGIPFRPCAVR